MSRELANCSPYPPAPRFGRNHSHIAALAMPHIEPSAWRPAGDLAILHRPALVTSLLQRVLACVREPVELLQVNGQPALYIAGLALLVCDNAGCIHGSMWVRTKSGELGSSPSRRRT